MAFPQPVYPRALAITTSDTVDLLPFTNESKRLTDGVYVGGAGAVVAVLEDGSTVTFSGALAGSILPIAVRRINATSTVATNLVALYAR